MARLVTLTPDDDSVAAQPVLRLRRGSVCREDNVSGHKFKIGQAVRYAAPFSHSAATDYKITLLLSAEDDELHRIKSANEPHERVAKESQLQRASN